MLKKEVSTWLREHFKPLRDIVDIAFVDLDGVKHCPDSSEQHCNWQFCNYKPEGKFLQAKIYIGVT